MPSRIASRKPLASTADAARWGLWRRLALLLIVPLILIGPSLRPGHRFLPQAPVQFEPLASEFPAAAARATAGANLWTGDRIFPVLTDQLELRERLLEGRGWTWEADAGLGMPLVGNVIHGPFYPPNLLLLVLPPDRAAAPLAILSLLLAGAGLWALLARLELGEWSCAFGAAALQGLGWGVVNLHYGMKVDAALWLAWNLWALEGLRRGERGSAAWLAAFTGASFLAGFPPIAVFVAGATALVGLARLRSGRGLLTLVVSLAIGVGLAAVQLAPTLAASLDSYRTPKGSAELAAEASQPAANLGLVVPELFGSPTEPTPPFGPVAAWWLNAAEDWERTQSVVPLEWTPWAGITTLVLALIGVICAPRRAAVPVGLLLLAHGFAQAWPGFSLLYGLPGLNGGSPTRALAVAWVAWPWLAAVGLDALRDGRATRLGAVWTAELLCLLGATLALTFADGRALIASQERRYVEAHQRDLGEVRQVLRPEDAERAAERLFEGFATTAAIAGLLGLAIALSGSPGRRRFPVVASLGLLVAESLWFSAPHLVPRDLGGLSIFPQSEAMRTIARTVGDGRLIRLDTSASGLAQVEGLARPNLPYAYGIRDVSAYVAFTPRPTVDHFADLDPGLRARSGVGGIPSAELLDSSVLDDARVTCVLSVAPIEHPRLELVANLPAMAVHSREVLGDADAEQALEAVHRHADRAVLVGLAISLVAAAVGLGSLFVTTRWRRH